MEKEQKPSVEEQAVEDLRHCRAILDMLKEIEAAHGVAAEVLRLALYNCDSSINHIHFRSNVYEACVEWGE